MRHTYRDKELLIDATPLASLSLAIDRLHSLVEEFDTTEPVDRED